MSLHAKMLEIQRRVKVLQKTEKASQGYNYVTSTQVLSAIREAMDDVGVLLLVEVVEHDTRLAAMTTRGGGAVNWVGLTLKFTWVDAENPSDTLSSMWWAEGIDSAEKGVGKALTYGEKYFLLKTFHVPTDEADPDRGDSPTGYVHPARGGERKTLRSLARRLVTEYGLAKEEVRQLASDAAEELWGAEPDDWHALTEDQVAKLAEAIERRIADR